MVYTKMFQGSATWYAPDATEHELSATDQVFGALFAGCPMTQIKNAQLSHENSMPQAPCTIVTQLVRKRVNQLGPY